MFKEFEILRLFFEEPSKNRSVREAAKAARVAPATASIRLKECTAAGLLTYRAERTLDLYQANLESESYRDLKQYYTLRKIRDSGLLEALDEYYIKPTVVLFGSSAHGTDIETSDIDLVVISERVGEFPAQAVFEKKLKKSLHLFSVRSPEELRNERRSGSWACWPSA